MGYLPFLVPVTGLEPVRCRQRWILSPLRLPIPSHRHIDFGIISYLRCKFKGKFNIFAFCQQFPLKNSQKGLTLLLFCRTIVI